MFRHVVLLEFLPDTSNAQVETIAAGLRGLPQLVPGIVSFEVYVDLGLAEGNAQLGLVATFQDEATWRAYLPHPDHQVVVALIRAVLHRRLALQTEV